MNSTRGGCKFPQLKLNNPEIDQFFQKIQKPNCAQNGEENWVYVRNSRIYISENSIRRHGNISCTYTPFERKNNYEVNWLKTEQFSNGMQLKADFFKVDCKALDGAKFENLDAGIAESVQEKSSNISSTSPLFGLNIIMIALDSISRLAFLRTLPKTYQYLTDVLGTVVLHGYNIVGDGKEWKVAQIFNLMSHAEL
jgi:hypothetical protein